MDDFKTEQKLGLLSAALRTIGGNFDVPTLDLIFSVADEVGKNGDKVSIGDVRKISQRIAKKYQVQQDG